MTAVVLVHQGLDASAELELAAPDPRDGVRHRGGDRLVVTARADRAAMEWALALDARVVALTVGPPDASAVLAWARGRGAGDAVRVWDPALEDADLAATARVVAAAVRRIGAALVLAGERGLAGATGALPALVAAHLGWACADGVLSVAREGEAIVAERRLPGGRRETVAARAPAAISVTADSIEPRYVSVGARRDGARLGHAAWGLGDLGLTDGAVRAAVRLRVAAVDWPRPRARRAAPAAPARSAAERLRQLVGGGARPAPAAGGAAAPAPSTPAGPVEGSPGEVAERILAFLSERGFV